jgi:integrase/recombinase XerD
MKIQGFGQSKVLNQRELDKLFQWGFTAERDRTLFSICLHTGCRISEALALTVADVQNGYILLRKGITKGKKQTRMIPVNDRLAVVLDRYLREANPTNFLFPSHHNAKTPKQMSRAAADLILKAACERVNLKGVSTHSFRRTALTQMHNAGVPLRVIQRISGHSSLATLQRYLEVSDDQIVDAVSVIGVKLAKHKDKDCGDEIAPLYEGKTYLQTLQTLQTDPNL